jgi:hypothetical protein
VQAEKFSFAKHDEAQDYNISTGITEVPKAEPLYSEVNGHFTVKESPHTFQNHNTNSEEQTQYCD